MKFQNSTLILMLAALFMTGIVYIWEKEGRPQVEAKRAKENLIFDFEEKDVRSVVLKTKDYRIQFDRNSKAGTAVTEPKWFMKILEGPKESLPSPTPKPTESPTNTTVTPSPTAKPTASPTSTTVTPSPTAKPTASPSPSANKEIAANEPYVSYLLDLVAKGKAEKIQIDPRQGDGLDNPLATIELQLNDRQTHKLILGNSNFNNTYLYALANPPQQIKQPLEILLVSTDFRNAVERPLSEWKQEADKPTETDSKSENKEGTEKKTDKFSPESKVK